MFDLTPQVYAAFRWDAKERLTKRDEHIIAHYNREIDFKRMDTVGALNRCVGDIRGQNRHPKCEQRGVHKEPQPQP